MLKEEKGSTLITVLLIIVVFSVIGIGLIGLNVTNAKQATNTRNNLQATNLAEMGTSQLREEVFTKLLSTAYQNKTLSEIKTNLQTDLNTFIYTDYPINTTTISPKFKIEKAIVSTAEDASFEILKVEFKTVGTSENKQNKNVSGIFQLKRLKAFPSPPTGAIVFSQDVDYNSNTNQAYQTVYYTQDVELDSNITITVNIDLYAQGTIIQASNSDLWVKGNAYISSLDQSTNTTGNGNRALMCVDNTLYVYTSDINNKLPVNTSFTNCSSVLYSTPPNNGIFAKKVVYLSSSPEDWKKENLTVENVQYN
jgi:hypothetical protein